MLSKAELPKSLETKWKNELDRGLKTSVAFYFSVLSRDFADRYGMENPVSSGVGEAITKISGLIGLPLANVPYERSPAQERIETSISALEFQLKEKGVELQKIKPLMNQIIASARLEGRAMAIK